jgi:hypothetical protein
MLSVTVQDPSASAALPVTWTLLVYTVPASPTRKRAAIWREVKRLGALYLRDGVCALPDTEVARAGLQDLAERVHQLGGQATLVWEARLSRSSAEALHRDLLRARQTEYAEVAEAAAGLLQHIREEAVHHSFDRPTLLSFGSDLMRLARWLEQISARDYLRVGDPGAVAATLAACRAELRLHSTTTAPVAS